LLADAVAWGLVPRRLWHRGSVAVDGRASNRPSRLASAAPSATRRSSRRPACAQRAVVGCRRSGCLGCPSTFVLGCWLTLPSLHGARTNAPASVRSGCAQGKHRAHVLMALVADWVGRTICSCWHVGLGTAQDFHAATAWLREGLQWLDKQDKFAAPWSRHVLADGSEPLPNATAIADGRRGLPRCQIVDARLRSSCAHVLRMARKYRLAQPFLRTDDDWLGLKSGDSTARPPFAPRSGALVLGCDSTLRARAPACGRHPRPRF